MRGVRSRLPARPRFSIRRARSSALSHDSKRESRRAVADLRWYFTRAESECGLRSNYGGMIYRLAMGGHSTETPTYEIDDRVLEVAARGRQIERALKAMDPSDREVVWRAYGAP